MTQLIQISRKQNTPISSKAHSAPIALPEPANHNGPPRPDV